MKRFFAESIFDDRILLSDEEMHHCTHVLRTQDKELVEVTDGKGNLWLTTVHFINKKQIYLEVEKQLVVDAPHPAKCSLAVAPTKNVDRIEWLVEKAVEIGIKDFYPILTERTERNRLRIDRLEKIALAAMKQSLRLWKPIIHEPILFEKLIQENTNVHRYIAYCEDEFEKIAVHQIEKQDALVFIGPEGDFTHQEVAFAVQNHVIPLSLGNVRLRVETAALVACVLVNQ
ncbi:MAG: 16S rRNA (uracil(1498)-N(3))-methyltransferase [Chitinophagales bacterium]|nr:16S rRNA (uracil(1498)-N(3))-methyltransferase [Chitinophagales bacterium]